jgi:hypothetical protein
MVPFLVGVAWAGEPLTNNQMDQVTAGFSSLSIADAEGLVGQSGVVLATTASLSEVLPIATATAGETHTTLFKSLAAAQSSTVTSSTSVLPLPGQP